MHVMIDGSVEETTEYTGNQDGDDAAKMSQVASLILIICHTVFVAGLLLGW